MSLGDGESCVVLGARVVCWGDRKAGGLRAIPLPFSSPPIAVTVGRSHRCALLEDGKVACWTGRAAAEIVPFPGGSSALSVTAGDEFVCALLVGGAVSC
jgi:hypothetical protein